MHVTQWLAENWFVVLVGIVAAIALFRSGRRHRGCCGDTTLPESRHALRSGPDDAKT